MLTVAQIKALGGYGIIYIDPGWDYDDDGGRGAAENHYDCVSGSWLESLPIKEIAAPDCALFMWATHPFVREAMKLGECERWGFEYKTLAFMWFKYRNNSCRPHYGNGRWTRANTEPVYLFTRGKPKRCNKGVDQFIETIGIDEEIKMLEWLKQDTRRCIVDYFNLIDDKTIQAPVREHSRKPDEVRHRIKRLMGAEIPAIEIFGRERAAGWDCCGNDPKIGSSDIVDFFPKVIITDETKAERKARSRVSADGSIGLRVCP